MNAASIKRMCELFASFERSSPAADMLVMQEPFGVMKSRYGGESGKQRCARLYISPIGRCSTVRKTELKSMHNYGIMKQA